MRSSNRVVQLVCLGIIAFSLVASGVFSTAIAAEAGRAQLVYADQTQEGDPPEVALGIAMGAFRGLFVNYLWLRATKLKEDGKYYEAIELSSAITKLQPRFPRVWAFHAWNMAYNISVATNTAEERWEWVKAGIALLRDQGIPRNPNDLLIHKELAWIFVHKIQGFSDDANRYYKRMLAREWAIALGPPPLLPEDDTEAATKLMVDWMQVIASAPDGLQEVIDAEIAEKRKALRPGEEGTVLTSKVAELSDRIRTSAGLPKDKEFGIDLLRFVLLHDAYKGSWYAGEKYATLQAGVQNSIIGELRDDPQFTDAWTRLLPWARRRVLIDTYHMEPDRMVRLTEKFGPLDWRHPATHAIYWSQRGVEETFDRLGKSSFDTLNTDRITIQGVQELWRSGTVLFDPITDEYVTLNNLHFTDTYGKFWQELTDRREMKGFRAFELNNEGYENFLRDAIRVYYRMGRYADAGRYFKTLREAPWKNINDRDKADELGFLTLDEFVAKSLREDRLSVPHVAASEALGSIRDAFYRGLLRNDAKMFKLNMDYAKIVHTVYFEQKQTVDPVLAAGAQRMEDMPRNFDDAVASVFIALLSNQDMEQFNAAAIFRKAPASIQLRCYDILARMFVPNRMPAQQFQDMFPEPAGLEQYRAMREEQRKTGREGAKEQLELEQK